jgi:hypothetical protein
MVPYFGSPCRQKSKAYAKKSERGAGAKQEFGQKLPWRRKNKGFDSQGEAK